MGRTLVSPKPKRNEIIEFFCTWKKISVQFKMRIAIAIFSTLIVTFFYLDISFALPTNTKTQADIRASLITKDNVAQYLEAQRQKKALENPILPEPFVVTTSLNIREKNSPNTRNSRTWFDKEDGAIVIEGQRMPDDDPNERTYRNGRFINNIFVPNDQPVPEEVTVEIRQPKSFNFDDFYKERRPQLPDNMAMESRNDNGVYVKPPADFQQSRDYKYHAGNTNQGNPVYYVVEEPDSLHSDRSPYDFEPADTHTSLSSTVSDYTQSGLTHATSGDFVIKEHTYSMCAGCPTFSIPVPIPKAIAGSENGPDGLPNYQYALNRTFLEKIGDRIINGFQKVQTTVLEVIDPILETGESFLGIEDDENALVAEKIDQLGSATESNSNKYMPIAIASVAAMAIGGMALFASSSPAYQYIIQVNQAKSFDDTQQRIVEKSIDYYD